MGIHKQIAEKKWTAWEAGLAYLDLVPSCSHPSEFVLCFLHAAFWLFDDLEKKPRLPINDIYAHSKLIIDILKQSYGIASIALHPGMQLYASRLALRGLDICLSIEEF